MIQNEAALINAGLQAGLLDREQLNRIRAQARTARQSLLDTLTQELGMPRTAFYLALAAAHVLPYARLDTWKLDHVIMGRLPSSLLKRHLLAPLRNPDGQLHLGVNDPADHASIETARRIVGSDTPLAVVEPEVLGPLLFAYLPPDLRDRNTDDAVSIFDRLVRDALLRRASDLHIESVKDGVRVRLRIDGSMQPCGGLLPRALGDGLISRVKVLSGMDIAESRAPQDGGMSHQLNEAANPVEMRVASAPAKFGERLTLRIMKSSVGQTTLDQLGMRPKMVEKLRSALAHPHGIILVTGPTGSGKSTTLYSVLRELDADALNILTAEDPVEQVVNGVTQVQVGGKVGFSTALRSFLRHDPDVILVGEIRDYDTADVALKAATTGHMVLSTLHTNTSAGAITRLADIGCERFLLGATLQGIIAQRLLRLLCPHCKTSRAAEDNELSLLGIIEKKPTDVWEPIGCPRCLGTGYRGRIGIFEALWLDEDLAEHIAAGANEGQIARHATDYWRLCDDAREKVLSGLTSFSEAKAYLNLSPKGES